MIKKPCARRIRSFRSIVFVGLFFLLSVWVSGSPQAYGARDDLATQSEAAADHEQDSSLSVVDDAQEALRQQQDPEPIRFESVNHIGGEISDIEPAGDLVWIVRGPRLTAIDFTDPTAPKMMEPGLTFDGEVAISVRNTLGFSLGAGCPCVLDLTVPAIPRIVARIDIADSTGNFVVVGRHAYVMQTENRIAVVDLSVPAEPKVVRQKSVQVSGRFQRLGSRIAVVGQGIVSVVDVVNPAEPRELGVIRAPESWDYNFVHTAVNRINGWDLLVFFLDGDRLLSYDIRHPDAPKLTEHQPDLSDMELGYISSIAITDRTRLCVSSFRYIGFTGEREGKVHCTPKDEEFEPIWGSVGAFRGPIVVGYDGVFVSSEEGIHYEIGHRRGLFRQLTVARELQVDYGRIERDPYLLAASGFAVISAPTARDAEWHSGGNVGWRYTLFTTGGGLICHLNIDGGAIHAPVLNIREWQVPQRGVTGREMFAPASREMQMDMFQHSSSLFFLRDGQLVHLDLSKDRSSAWIRDLELDRYVHKVASSGERIILIAGNQDSDDLSGGTKLELRTYSFSEPPTGPDLTLESIREIGDDTTGGVKDISMWGSQAIVRLKRHHGWRLQSYDLASLARDQPILDIPVEASDRLHGVWGGYAFVGTKIYDIHQPGIASLIGEFAISHTEADRVWDVAATDNAFFVSQGAYGMEAFEHSLPWHVEPDWAAVEPIATPIDTPTPSMTPTASNTPTPSDTPTQTLTPSATNVPDLIYLPTLRKG